MMEPKDRLIQAIQEAGFAKPTDAWRANQRALGISQDLIISNTNGNRPISKKTAERYARVFGRSAGWYLFGDGEPASEPKEIDAEAKLRAALLAFGVDRKSLSRAVAAVRAGFVKGEDTPAQSPRRDPPEPASRPHAKAPSR